jgi:hypothetical protein
MTAFGFSGRLLIAILFLTSGVQKLIQTPPLGDGYTEAALVQSKLNTFSKSVQDATGFIVPLEKVIDRVISLLFATHDQHECAVKCTLIWLNEPVLSLVKFNPTALHCRDITVSCGGTLVTSVGRRVTPSTCSWLQ